MANLKSLPLTSLKQTCHQIEFYFVFWIFFLLPSFMIFLIFVHTHEPCSILIQCTPKFRLKVVNALEMFISGCALLRWSEYGVLSSVLFSLAQTFIFDFWKMSTNLVTSRIIRFYYVNKNFCCNNGVKTCFQLKASFLKIFEHFLWILSHPALALDSLPFHSTRLYFLINKFLWSCVREKQLMIWKLEHQNFQIIGSRLWPNCSKDAANSMFLHFNFYSGKKKYFFDKFMPIEFRLY